ncbi:hypothetical protein ABPG77_002062 [Micractinium sp. CCAP 211/92]
MATAAAACSRAQLGRPPALVTRKSTRVSAPARAGTALRQRVPTIQEENPTSSPAPAFPGELCKPLDRKTAAQYLQQLDGWQLQEDSQGRLHLQRSYCCGSFAQALALCDRIAAVADGEGHHPDLHLNRHNCITVSLFTKARNGLTENDAILAFKLERINKLDLLAPPRPWAPARA